MLAVLLLGVLHLPAPPVSATPQEESEASSPPPQESHTTGAGTIPEPTENQKRETTVLGSGDLESAPEADVVPESMSGIDAAEVDVLNIWFQRLRARQEGADALVRQASERIVALMDRDGIQRMATLAAAFSYEGYRQLQTGNYERARESFEWAVRFDPSLPAGYFGLAHARRLTGEGVGAFFQENARGMRAALGNFWWTYIRLSNLMFLALVALSLASMAFVALLVLRYQVPWRHGMFEWLKQRGVPESLARLLSAAVLLLPLVFWISGPWVLLYWLAGTFRYTNVREKIVAVGVGVFGVVAAPALGLTLIVFQITANDTFRATISAMNGGYEPEKVRYIQQLLRESPDDLSVRFLLALQLKEGGYFLQAFEHYKAVLDLRPDHHGALNNVGNIYFATGQYGQSLIWYRRATEANPDFSPAYFNSYLAQKELFHFTESEASLDRARSLDPDAVARFLEREGQEAAASPVDAKIRTRQAWAEMVRESRRVDKTMPGSKVITAGFTHPLSLASGLAIVLMVALGVLLPRDRARRCSRCGWGFCARCQGAQPNSDLCPQCLQLRSRKDVVSHDARAHKERQIGRYQKLCKLVRRLVGLVAPGTAQMLVDRTLLGMILNIVWALVLAYLLLGDRLLHFTANPIAEGVGPGVWVAAVAAVAVWILGNFLPPGGARLRA